MPDISLQCPATEKLSQFFLPSATTGGNVLLILHLCPPPYILGASRAAHGRHSALHAVRKKKRTRKGLNMVSRPSFSRPSKEVELRDGWWWSSYVRADF